MAEHPDAFAAPTPSPACSPLTTSHNLATFSLQPTAPTPEDAHDTDPMATASAGVPSQRRVGDHTVQRLLATHTLQRKLTVGAAHDPYEQEADRVAAQVMRMPASEAEEVSARPVAAPMTATVQRRVQEDMRERPAARATQADHGRTSDDVEHHLSATRSVESAQLNHEVNAQGFTVGSNMYLGEGQTDGASSASTHARAHDETHVGHQEEAATKSRPNNTGLPDELKVGMESLSNYSLDNVRVHYNSNKPAQLQALAYTQGTNIYVAPGQEKHLPHEAWHVVQQQQGRVNAMVQIKGMHVNYDVGLEQEADLMGEKALNLSYTRPMAQVSSPSGIRALHQQTQQRASLQLVQTKLKPGVLNVAGETHSDYEGPSGPLLREKERTLATKKVGGGYWEEPIFKVSEDSLWYGTTKNQSGDPILLQVLYCLEVVNQLGGKVLSQLDPSRPGQARLLRDVAENCYNTLTDYVQPRFRTLQKEFDDDLVSLSEKQVAAANKLLDQIEGMQTACSELMTGIRQDGQLSADLNDILQLRDNSVRWHREIVKQGAILNGGKAIIEREMRISRSKQMHFSAQASCATPGIWKIGTNHYKDIVNYVAGFFVAAPKYNLLSEKEFNREVRGDV